MNHMYHISNDLLLQMNRFLGNEKFAGTIAPAGDIIFLTDGTWLKDSAVIEVICNRNGAWDVHLIFAHYQNPLKLIVRNITRCFSEQKARTTAFYIRKETAKDSRGTLTVSIKYFDLCKN